MSVRSSTSKTFLAVAAIAVLGLALSTASAVDINAAASSATSTINGYKVSIANLIGALIDLFALIFCGIYFIKYQKDHSVENLIRIGAGIVVLAIGTTLILAF
jgi:hypothetical protein